MSVSKFSAVILIFNLFAVMPVFAEQGEDDAADMATDETPFSSERFEIFEPELSADVVGFTLQGKSISYSFRISDLDIVYSPEGDRLLPLLRLLRELLAKGESDKTKIKFSFVAGRVAIVDLQDSSLTIGQAKYPLTIISGISDVTGEGEIFVSENVFAQELGVELQWDDNEYAYNLNTAQHLYLFQSMDAKRQNRLRGALSEISSNLEATEPISLAKNSRRLLNFVNFNLRLDSRYSGEDIVGTIRPEIIAYGNLAGGNYKLTLSESIEYPDPQYPQALLWVKDALWTSRSEKFAVRAGDTGMGLSNLVIPSTSFTGLVGRGLAGGNVSDNNRKRFLDGRLFNFSAESNYSGYAPVGSKVELLVNNRLVFSEVVEIEDGERPGDGKYEFKGIGLLSRSVNEVETVVTHIDGTQDVYRETVIGNPSLLPGGTLAYTAGLGTKRQKVENKLETHGLFSGLGIYYGINDHITLGLSGVFQESFFARPGSQQDISSDSSRLPKRAYLAQRLSVRLPGNFLLSEEIGVNRNPGVDKYNFAKDLILEYIREKFLFSSYLFSYDRGYSTGANELGDREGFGVFTRWEFVKGIALSSAYASIDNLDKNRDETYLVADINSGQLIPKSTLAVRRDILRKSDSTLAVPSTSRDTLTVATLDIRPTMNLDLKFENSIGDQINSPSDEDLRNGIPVPLVGTVPPFGRRAEAKYNFPKNISTGLIYRNSGTGSENIEFSLQRVMRHRQQFDVKLLNRHDLNAGTNFYEMNIEYPFDHQLKNILGLRANYSEANDGYNVFLYVKLGSLLSSDRGRLSRVISKQKMNPEVGGLKGRVYLDANANGHYDDGEQGLEGIEVIGGRRRYTSGPGGFFYITRMQNIDTITVSLDEKELSAIYTPIQGKQEASWDEFIFTRANLGVSVLGAITGQIASWENDDMLRPIPGLVVMLAKISDGSIVKTSITDDDGIYYLGEVIPGDYEIRLKPDSIPPELTIDGDPPKVELRAEIEPVEIEDVNVRLVSKEDGAALSDQE